MIVSGDECRRTQKGNNNAYCQDNDISWFDWTGVEKHAEVFRFTKALNEFRQSQPTVRQRNFFSGRQAEDGLSDVNWYSPLGTAVDWSSKVSAMICLKTAPDENEDPDGLGRDVLMMINATGHPLDFVLPAVAKSSHWRLAFDTAAQSPMDAYSDATGPALPMSGRVTLLNQSFRCYVASGANARLRPTVRRT